MATFDREDTYNKIVTIVVDKLGIDKELVLPSSTFETLGADSLDVVEIMMTLEEQFSIEIKDEDAEQMDSMSDVVDYIHQKGMR